MFCRAGKSMIYVRRVGKNGKQRTEMQNPKHLCTRAVKVLRNKGRELRRQE